MVSHSLKTCSKCNESKPLDSFYKRQANKDGYSCVCKECQRRYDTRDNLKRYWQTKRNRASILEFTVTEDYLRSIWTDTCPALSIPIGLGKHQADDGLAHLDRIDSSKGYVEGNVQWLSAKANRIKSNATLDELKKVVKHMEELNNA